MNKINKAIIFILSPLVLSSCALFSPSTSRGSSEKTSQQVVKEFSVIRNDTGAEIENGSTIEIEAYYDFYLSATSYGESLTGASISASNSEVILAHSKSFYPIKAGSSQITVSYSKGGKSYSLTFTVNVSVNSKIKSIYVANEERGIRFNEEGNVEITGKIFAESENGIIRCLNGEDYSTLVQEGKDSGHKKVTITYESNGQSYSASYEVPLQAKSPIEKTEIKQTFSTYYNNGYYKAYPKVDSEGSPRILAIPVWFSDSNKYINASLKDRNGKNQKEQIIEDLNYALFGDPIRKSDQSVKSYYASESAGRLNVSGKVSEWYETSYASTVNYFSDRTARETLLESAYAWYKNETSDSSTYDCVVLCYGSNHYGPESNAYTAFSTSIYSSTVPTNYIWYGAMTLYDANDKDIGQMETADLSDLCLNDAIDAETIIHEFAHTLGADDAYSDSRASDTRSIPAGNYTMQAGDAGGHDSRTLLTYGWSSPYVYSADRSYSNEQLTITIDDVQSSGDCIILSPSWNEYDSPFDEYIVIELFAKTGVNNYCMPSIDATGLRVYHVESRLYDFNTKQLVSDATTSGAVVPFTNTYGKVRTGENVAELKKYGNMDLLHLIRKNTVDSKGNEIGYLTTDYGWTGSWFVEGDTFSMNKYAKQFYVEGKLDDGQDLGWSFTVDSIAKNEHGCASATITLKADK